ncbi:MAG: alpha-N-arabinofuranosidase, partial [Clostridia bacterium]|nr:alpha-N-arabinofuranosidase [Clostridia bacterium]
QYIQDMLDLVEFARGDADSTWGKVRASLGHPEPFDLPFIAIGNENEGNDYYERFTAFRKAFDDAKAENPALYDGIELIYSAGASDATHGANYIKSYEYAEQWLQANPGKTALDFAGATDQHYYNDPEWFLQNADYYDRGVYGRTDDEITATRYGGAIPVFLGEYAARSNRLRAALAEAAYMTGLERNGDIVRMAAYAPLFGNLTATHWSPDLIWYNNHQVTGSINYYVQKLFMRNQGKTLLRSTLDGAAVPQKEIAGKIGVGTWYTSAAFDNVKITDNKTGKVLGRDRFTLPGYFVNWTTPTDGKWRTKSGRLVQLKTSMNYSNTGSVAYFGDDTWSNYTYELDAEKLAGEEGFMISFGVQDTENNIIWNIGGWQNTVSCLQIVENGEKTGQIPGTVKPFTAEEGKTYHLKIVVDGRRIQCYIDDELYVDFKTGSDSEAEAYQVVSTDDSGDVIVKLVNVTDSDRTFAIQLDQAVAATAQVSQLKGDSLDNDNILGQPEACKIEDFTLDGVSEQFNYTVPQYSVTVLRLSK